MRAIGTAFGLGDPQTPVSVGDLDPFWLPMASPLQAHGSEINRPLEEP